MRTVDFFVLHEFYTNDRTLDGNAAKIGARTATFESIQRKYSAYIFQGKYSDKY